MILKVLLLIAVVSLAVCNDTKSIVINSLLLIAVLSLAVCNDTKSIVINSCSVTGCM